MDESAQWQEINYPTFFGAICSRIKNARITLDTSQVKAVGTDWLETNVNLVPVLWREEGDDCLVKIGERVNNEPFYDFRFPTSWLG